MINMYGRIADVTNPECSSGAFRGFEKRFTQGSQEPVGFLIFPPAVEIEMVCPNIEMFPESLKNAFQA